MRTSTPLHGTDVTGSESADMEARLAACRQALYNARKMRPTPVLDNKVHSHETIHQFRQLCTEALAGKNTDHTNRQCQTWNVPDVGHY